MSFESYKVAVQLSLVNGMSSGIMAIASQFTSLDKTITGTRNNVTQLERELASLKKTALIGGAMVTAGGFGLSLLAAPIEAAKQYELATARFKTLNLGDAVNKEADAFARGAGKFGVSATQMMDALSTSIGMFGNMGLATELAPVIAELNAANSALFGGKAGAIDDSGVRSIMRFNDMRGLTNTPQDFRRGLDLAQRLVTGSGGAIKFNDLEQLAKTGGAAFKGMSDEGIMTLASVMQEQGGARTGTALMSMYQNLIAGRTTKKTMAALEAAGLVTMGQVRSGTIGGKPSYSTQITGVKDEQMLRENPGGWLMKYGVEAAKKSGAKTDSEVIGFINTLLSNRTGSNMAATFTTQQLEVLRDLNLAKNAKGAQGTIDLYKNTAAGGIANFNAKMEDLKIALGQGLLPVLIKVVTSLNSMVSAMTKFANENPKLTAGLVKGFAVLSALVAAGGVVMLATASFKALGLALAFNSVGGAMGIGKMATSIGLVSKAFGAFNAVALAAMAGWAAGTLIGKGIDAGISKATGRDETLGTWLYGAIHGEYNENSKSVNGVRLRTGTTNVAPHSHDIVVDGQKLGNAAAKNIAKSASKPANGGTNFDQTRAPFTPQMNWANQ